MLYISLHFSSSFPFPTRKILVVSVSSKGVLLKAVVFSSSSVSSSSSESNGSGLTLSPFKTCSIMLLFSIMKRLCSFKNSG